MSYNEFLQFIFTPISYFVNWLNFIANSLIHNYIFITFLGITIFISLFWLFFNFVHNLLYSRVNYYEDFNDKYYNYELSQKAKQLYLDKHFNDVYEYQYKYDVLKQQVLNSLYHKNRDLLLENRIENINLRIDALKSIQKNLLSNNDSSDDNDLNYVVSNPPVSFASVNELKQKNKNLFQDFPNLHNDLINENNDSINKIINDNKSLLKKYNLSYQNGHFVDAITGEVIKNINSKDSDNLRHINGKTINIHTGEVVSECIDPIPVGDIELSHRTPEQIAEIEKYNNEHFIFPTSNKNHKYGNFDEDLDAQLFD